MKVIATGLGVSLASVLLSVSPARAQQASSQVITDIGDIQPADPKKFYKKPGYSPYAGKHYPERPYLATSTCTPAGRSTRAWAARR